jgi:hypothetical protein
MPTAYSISVEKEEESETVPGTRSGTNYNGSGEPVHNGIEQIRIWKTSTVSIINEYQMLLRRISKRGEYEKGDEITRVKDSRS